MLNAKVGIAKVGTTTLEASLLNMNTIVAYQTSFTHYLIGKHLVNLKYVALPNILANKEIIPEYIQHKAKPSILADKVLDFLSNEEECQKQKEEFQSIRKMLSNEKKCDIAAEILKELKR